jgi:hypothetical protein
MSLEKQTTPLIHLLSKHKRIKTELMTSSKPIYNPETQISNYNMGGQTTSCSKGTDGTKPKNEADKVMDDN